MNSIDRAAQLIAKEELREGLLTEIIKDRESLYVEMKKLSAPSWNSFMTDMQNVLPGTITTETINKAMSKLVGRKP